MLKIALIAALGLAAAGVVPAAADDMRAQYGNDSYGYNNRYNYNADGGVGRYCAPGLIPQVYPNGNGIRCESPDHSFYTDK